MSTLIELIFCFLRLFESWLLIPLMNLPKLPIASGHITNELEDEGVLSKSIIESFWLKRWSRAKRNLATIFCNQSQLRNII